MDHHQSVNAFIHLLYNNKNTENISLILAVKFCGQGVAADFLIHLFILFVFLCVCACYAPAVVFTELLQHLQHLMACVFTLISYLL